MSRFKGLLILVLLAGCAGSKDPVARGRSYFVGLGCITCHRIGDKGGGQAGPDLTTVGFRKTPEWLRLWLANPAAWKPGTAMPNFKLKDNVREDLVAYLTSLKGEIYRAKPPWDAPAVKGNPLKRGEMLFTRVGCVGCHGERGQGGYPNNNVVGGKILTLTYAADGYSKDEMRALLHKGRVSLPADASLPPPMIRMPAWGQYLTDDEINDLVEYVFSLRPATTAKDDWSE